MAISQTLTPYPNNVPAIGQDEDTYSANAFSKAVHDVQIVSEMNTVIGQINTTATEINTAAQTATTKAGEAASSADAAAQSAAEAEGAVAALPDGTINDATTGTTSTWSSSKIDNDKQDTLIDGTSIKTVNGSSVLGSGNLSLLPTTGGAMTGAITSLRETSVAMAANNIDLSLGNHFAKTISGVTTLTVSNVPAAGQLTSFILELTNAGSAAITWFSGVKWAGGKAPTLTAAGVDILGFYAKDGGATWRGLVLAKDSK